MRAHWQKIADSGVADPSGAQDAARRLAAEIRKSLSAGPGVDAPVGYLYAGAHQFVAKALAIETEPLPTEADPNRPSLLSTGNTSQAQIVVPFNCMVHSIVAFATPKFNEAPNVPFTWPLGISGAEEGRDLFTVRWDINGDVNYQTDGFSPIMLPGSVVTGTQNKPRSCAWILQRETRINVTFRNITNYFTQGLGAGADFQNVQLDATLVFSALNLDGP